MTGKTPKSAARHFAKTSWLSPVLVCFILGFRAQWGPEVGLVVPAVVMLTLGIGLALLSLFGIRREGPRQILPQATVGLVFNVFMFGMFVYTMRGH